MCREHLANGRREDNYWLVGDVENTPGRSLYVRLKGPQSGKGAAGKWREGCGDRRAWRLLDLIRESCRLATFHDVADEARQFLSLPRLRTACTKREPSAKAGITGCDASPVQHGAATQGTLADHYLRARSILHAARERSLRFHPNCYYRDLASDQTFAFPALIAGVTDLCGRITGVHRTWLDPDGDGKAHVADPRRSMGHLLGNGVRFGLELGSAVPVMAAGESANTLLKRTENRAEDEQRYR